MNDNQFYPHDFSRNPSADGEGLPGRPSLRVRRTVRDHTVVVEARGEIDLVTAPMLDEQLEHAAAVVVPPAPVVVDLTRVAFIDARGLGMLVHHHDRCRSIGSALWIVARHRAVLRPIEVTGLDLTLCVVPDAHDALPGKEPTA